MPKLCPEASDELLKNILIAEWSNYIVNVSLVNNGEILVKMTLKSGGWQSQSQWSSVVLMHSGFAYFCDESSGSWKILGKLREGQQTNVIYPGKDRNAWRNIARRFSACSLNFTFARKCGKVVRCSTNTAQQR